MLLAQRYDKVVFTLQDLSRELKTMQFVDVHAAWDDVKELEEKIDSMKQTFGSIAADPTSVVPAALATYCQDYEFADVHTAWNGAEEARTKEEADMFVNTYCSQLVSSIIVSSKGTWIYVTQAEAYMRNARNVDDCANTTITITNPAKARFIVE